MHYGLVCLNLKEHYCNNTLEIKEAVHYETLAARFFLRSIC